MHSKLWKSSILRYGIAGAAILAVVGGIYRADRSVGTADDFFSRNPHLVKQAVAPVEPVLVRTNDDFMAGDYRLLRGQAYEVIIDHEVQMTTDAKSIGAYGFRGKINLHSFGVQKGILTVLVDYSLAELKGALKLSPTSLTNLGIATKGATKIAGKAATQIASPSDRRLLVRLDPAGKIREVYSASAMLDPAALEVQLTALNLIFRKLPPITLGLQNQTEWDDAGIAFPTQYRITDVGGDILRVIGQASVKQAMGTSEKSAAAAGAPALALMQLEHEISQETDWLWNRKLGLPKTQKVRSGTELKSSAGLLSAYRGNASAVWSDAVLSVLKESELASYRVPVDFRAILRGMDRSATASVKGNVRTSRAWLDLAKSLQALNPRTTDTERDALFMDLSRSVRGNPQMIESLKATAFDAAPGSRPVSMLLGALGSEGSPAAQAAMLEIARRERATDEEKIKVMTEFALLQKPLTDDAKRFLREQYQGQDPLRSDLSGSAGLALGASVAKDGDPETIRLLRDEYASADGILGLRAQPEKQAYLLTAMGNSKSDAFVKETREAAESENTVVRSAAVNAVRFAQDERSREILFEALTHDHDPAVRTTAAESLLYQPFDEKTRTGLQNCGQSESSIGPKLECYRVLSVRIDQPGVREFLQNRKSAEVDPQVKTMIEQALTIQPTSDAT